MGDSATSMGNKVSNASKNIDTNYRTLMLSTAGVIANSIQLGDIMDRMARGQMDVSRGALLLSMNFLQLTSMLQRLATAEHIATIASWAHTAAKHAEAIAIGIVHALSGPWGWAILLGAAAMAATVYSLANTIPSKQAGGLITQTGPYLLHAGEYVTPKGAHSITVNVYGAGSPQETADSIIDALRRHGSI